MPTGQMNIAAFLCVLSITFSFSVSAQPRDLQREFGLTLLAHRDTVSVLAGDTVSFTDAKWNWRDPPTCRLLVFDSQRETNATLAASSVTRGVGGGVQYVVHSRLRFDSAGIYTVLRIVEGRAPDNRLYRYGDVWLLRVRWPTLHALVDTEHFYGEVASFSFLAGHRDARRYSYTVHAGTKTLFSDSGAIVSIERIWRDYGAEAMNSTVTVHGKYENAPFRYEDPVTGQTRESVWRFLLKAPDRIAAVTLWQEDSTFDRLKAEAKIESLYTFPLGLNAHGKYNPHEFRFTSYAVIRRNFLMFMPEVGNVTITSEPSAFIASTAWKTDDPWRVLLIVPNQEIVEDRSLRNPLEVRLTIRFTDQFNNVFQRIYKARVYSNQILRY